MKAFDYNAVVVDGPKVFCVECLPEELTVDSETVHPIFASDEWDYYPCCDKCGREHDYVGLTGVGEAMRESIARTGTF